MSHIKPKSTDARRSPVSPQNATRSNKPKPPKVKVSKVKPVSNGFHEVSNGVEKLKSNSVAKEKDEVAKMNLLTLQKVDRSVSEIVDTVPHVVLYEFKTAENMWERTSSEGTLFVYNKSRGSSRAGFMILNRLNSDNTQEAVVPGMEFRLQPPFILYGKESGSVFGLCIQDKDRCVKTRELLNRLSSEASSGGSSDCSSSSSPSSSPPTKILQKQSISPVPTERQDRNSHVASTGPKGPKDEHRSSQQQPSKGTGASRHSKANSSDVMEKLEAAGRGYLGGQSFSDDTDSHDEALPASPPKGGVATRTTAVPTSARNGVTSHSNTLQMKHVHSVPDMARGGNQRATSPKEIPHRGGQSQPGYQLSPQKVAAHDSSSTQQQQQKEQQRKKAGSPSNPQHAHHGGQSSSPGAHRAPMHHSASFDHARNYAMTPEGAATHYGGGRSNSMFGGSPYGYTSTPAASAPGRGYHSAYLPSRVHSTAPAGGPADESIVRKLFSEVPPATSASSATVGVSLQTLFSQAQVATPISGSHLSYSTGSLQGLPQQRHHAPAPLVSALSLDEIEKKLTEEAPSPSPKGTADSGLTMVAPTTSSSVEGTVLLQPSAFVIPPPTSSSAVVTTAQLPIPSTTASSVVPAPQVFPAIPPLMPSAGMTAPPMKTQSSTLATVSSSPVKAAQKSAAVLSSHHTPKGKTPAITTAREHLSAIPEAQTPSRAASTAAAGEGSSNTKPSPELTLPPGRSFTAPSATLMSPQQFSQGHDEGKGKAAGTGGGGGGGGASQGKKAADIGLTREQMQEALVYMIENDHDFINKLHEAYKASLTKRLL